MIISCSWLIKRQCCRKSRFARVIAKFGSLIPSCRLTFPATGYSSLTRIERFALLKPSIIKIVFPWNCKFHLIPSSTHGRVVEHPLCHRFIRINSASQKGNNLHFLQHLFISNVYKTNSYPEVLMAV